MLPPAVALPAAPRPSTSSRTSCGSTSTRARSSCNSPSTMDRLQSVASAANPASSAASPHPACLIRQPSRVDEHLHITAGEHHPPPTHEGAQARAVRGHEHASDALGDRDALRPVRQSARHPPGAKGLARVPAHPMQLWHIHPVRHQHLVGLLEVTNVTPFAFAWLVRVLSFQLDPNRGLYQKGMFATDTPRSAPPPPRTRSASPSTPSRSSSRCSNSSSTRRLKPRTRPAVERALHLLGTHASSRRRHALHVPARLHHLRLARASRAAVDMSAFGFMLTRSRPRLPLRPQMFGLTLDAFSNTIDSATSLLR